MKNGFVLKSNLCNLITDSMSFIRLRNLFEILQDVVYSTEYFYAHLHNFIARVY